MSTSAPHDLKPEQIRAIIVGVEEYAAGASWRLDGPANDAVAFATWLAARQVPASNIHLFLSKVPGKILALPDGVTESLPTRDALESLLEKDLQQAPPRVLYFFWSGHGLIKLDETRRLITSDATNTNIRNLDLSEVLKYLRNQAIAPADPTRLTRQVFFIDTCADFAELRGAAGVAGALTDHALPQGAPVKLREQFVLLAARSGETAKNLTAEQTGLFSRELLRLLQRESADSLLPDLRSLTTQLEQVFQQLRADKHATQRPAYLWLRDWSGSEEQTGQPPGDLTRPAAPATSLASFLDRQAPTAGVPREMRARLCELTASMKPVIPDAITLKAFQLAHPTAIRVPNFLRGMERFRWCVYELGELAPRILLTFLELCRPQFKKARLDDAVTDWAVAVAGPGSNDLVEARQQATRLAPAMAQVVSSANILQIVVEPLPGPNGQDRFQLHMGRLVTDPEPAIQYLGSAEQPATDRQQLAAMLLPLFHRALDLGVTANDLQVEAVVPRDLLSAGVEDWKVLRGARREPVGHCHNVALRSYERAYAAEIAAQDPNRDYRSCVSDQQAKWNLLAADLQPDGIVWAGDATEFGRDFYLELRNPEVAAVAAVSLDPPVSADSDPAEDLISAGIPVAIWLHDHTGDWAATRRALEEQFVKASPSEWPARALKLRCQPPSKRIIACTQLTVLHDNPNLPTLRLPSHTDAALAEPKLSVP